MNGDTPLSDDLRVRELLRDLSRAAPAAPGDLTGRTVAAVRRRRIGAVSLSLVSVGAVLLGVTALVGAAGWFHTAPHGTGGIPAVSGTEGSPATTRCPGPPAMDPPSAA